ncbi:crinkler family protein [Gigaspora margarita]|uniref:Crinkler family protein n=1 Tax=Gigaspora margarita TaxID=4874 RepID=A0A8H3XIR1_GIGMA|nr:crinkler family protein [Gigaspora margarita]
MSVSGTPIILWCLIRGAIFKITIGRDDDIYELKEAIKKVTEPVFDIFSPLQLKLLKLKNPVNDEHISDIQNLSLQDGEDENDDVTLMKDMRKIADYWPENQAPPEDLIHVIVEAHEQRVAAKRSYDDIDRTDVICDALIQPFSFVPSRAGDLTSLINAPLTRKLPVSKNEEIKYPLLADFIEKNDECRSDLSTYISGLIIGIGKQNLSNTSENMLHWVVDSIIRIPLQIFHENLGGVLPIDLDRNTRDQGTTTIGTKRPDFLCWANNVLLFKGEEKAVNADFPKAVNELEEKFNKFDPMYFGNIQFMICYAAAGTRLRFFAIDGSSNTNSPSRLIALSNQLDINTRRDRISILCIVVNIARIIRTVSNTIPAMIVPLGKRLKTERSMITILGDSVEKRVSVEYLPFAENLNDRINFLSKLYEHAKGHTGLAQVKESPRISRQAIYKVVL